ncbi:Probable Zinc-ribbon domain containing protein, putative [Angomonas deanei]|uniref:Probable Zinc-ribbon domain containing protein, putative n=1 Tax=Angomonas deanei TaxID=59799 RepID=A0A7G2CTI1_9TRYP|nr:Probable Zinc-ribbon domain containing protein, putative [Angomonas deanei]
MFRKTGLLAAADFKQKSRWSAVWPNMRYGAMFLNYGVGRQMPMKGVNWVTRDSNRLTNFSERYGSVIDDLDVKRNEEELNIPLADIRWNDHRRIYWKCSFCGSTYRKSVSVRTKFHAGCNRCKQRCASEVLGGQTKVVTLKSQQPDLIKQLAANDKNDNIAGLAVTSKFEVEWTCRSCQKPFRATIRSRTGCVEEGQAPIYDGTKEWNAYCIDCRWKENMAPLAEKILSGSKDYLGLEQSLQENAGAEVKVPRRKKLVQ